MILYMERRKIKILKVKCVFTEIVWFSSSKCLNFRIEYRMIICSKILRLLCFSYCVSYCARYLEKIWTVWACTLATELCSSNQLAQQGVEEWAQTNVKLVHLFLIYAAMGKQNRSAQKKKKKKWKSDLTFIYKHIRKEQTSVNRKFSRSHRQGDEGLR